MKIAWQLLRSVRTLAKEVTLGARPKEYIEE